jgi:coenzyme F420-0:L-glutamate ligase/coenzyme F420-1:gamma-L-glutamate ligase
MRVELIPVPGLPEVRPGDDLVQMLAAGLRASGLQLRDGDVLAVTQKIVSKAEGRVVSEASANKAEWVARETRRVVARRDDLVIAETRHGFVCANAGVDASNVAEGFLSLLPEDPDGTAERIREGLAREFGASVGVVITDTFGRAWRQGLVNVAIGCAGLPPVIDLRGHKDAVGRMLEVTVVALADEVAAASGLVMGKADGVPAAIVRGLAVDRLDEPPGPASGLVRPREEDLFPESPLQALHSRRSVRTFGPGPVSRDALREAVRAACAAPSPHHTRPWLFVALDSDPARRRLRAALTGAWSADLRHDGIPEPVIEQRLERSEALLGGAPVLIVPLVKLQGARAYPDVERSTAERERYFLSAGAAIQNLMQALHAQGLASCWVSSTLFCKAETLEALRLGEEWIPLGAVAVGQPPEGAPGPTPLPDVDEFLREVP